MPEWISPHWIRTGARVVRNSSPPIDFDSDDVPLGTVGTLLGVIEPLSADQDGIRVEMPGLGITFHYELSSLLEEWGSIDVEGPPLAPGVPEWIQVGALIECFTSCSLRRYYVIPPGVVGQVIQVEPSNMGEDRVRVDVEGETLFIEVSLIEGCWRRYTLKTPPSPEPDVPSPTAHERLLDD